MMQTQQTDDARFAAHVRDAVRGAVQRGRPHFVGFLDMHQAALAQAVRADGAQVCCWGGYDGAERVIFGAFPPDYDGGRPYAWRDDDEPEISADTLHAAFPIVPLVLRCRAAVTLNHRDVLGALMGLGIERATVGDIRTAPGRCVCLVRRELAAHIAQQLTSVGREGVTVSAESAAEIPQLMPDAQPSEEISDTVASPRVDCVVASLAHCGRTAAAERIRAGLVQRNGVVCASGSDLLAVGDVLVIRGAGKFTIRALGPQTRKGRLALRADKAR